MRMVEFSWIYTMGLNIKNTEVESLAAEVSGLARETKTEAIRQALLDRRARLRARSGRAVRKGLRKYLERSVWPAIPAAQLGRALTRREEGRILGYGPKGY